MIGATLAVTALVAVLTLVTRPGAALGFVVASMLIWPEFLRVPVGIAQMSAPRMLALVLLFRLLALGRHSKLVVSPADKLVVFVWLFTIIAAVATGRPTAHQTQFIGMGLDTVLIYFTARLAVASLDDVRGLGWPLAITALIMGGLGAFEAVTFYSPFRVFDQYRTNDIWAFDKGDEFRYGFLRAHASTSVHIYFGLAMMVVTSLLWSVRKYAGGWIWPAMLAGVIGTLSSMSSGPWMALFVFIFMNFYFYRPSLIKPSLIVVAALAFALETISNRHFYNLIDYIALNGQTAWYRTRLMEVAVNHIGEYWLLGIGTKPMDAWAADLDGRRHIDIVNHFIIVAINGGLPALFAYVGAHVVAIRAGIKAWKMTENKLERSLLFGFCTTLLALDFASMSVGLFGPPLLLSNLALGLLVSISAVTKQSAEPSVTLRPQITRPIAVHPPVSGESRKRLGLTPTRR